MPMISADASVTVTIRLADDELADVLPKVAARGLPFHYYVEGSASPTQHRVVIELAADWRTVAETMHELSAEFANPA